MKISVEVTIERDDGEEVARESSTLARVPWPTLVTELWDLSREVSNRAIERAKGAV